MDELIRLGLAVVIAVALLAAITIARRVYRRRLQSHVASSANDLALRFELPSGEPAILYFSGKRCVQCRTLQEPALQRLTSAVPVFVRKLDAAEQLDLTRRFNILSVPATVVLGADHRVRGVNVGYTDEHTLRQQLA